jgi:cytochrome c553
MITLLLVVAGSFVAFVVLPRAAAAGPESLFAAFCSALGIPRVRYAGPIATATTPHSDVVLTHELLQAPAPADIGHGATLALRCTTCHGPTGISYANSPNLAGQYAAVIYKQLRDYKAGVRTNAMMNPMAKLLTDTEMQQLAAYYASLDRSSQPIAAMDAPAIVKWGNPMRNVAPCGSCHGDTEHSSASPWLSGEPEIYVKSQLDQFVAGTRTNDINGQMRAMARGMTSAEISAASAYYSGQTGAR